MLAADGKLLTESYNIAKDGYECDRLFDDYRLDALWDYITEPSVLKNKVSKALNNQMKQ